MVGDRAFNLHKPILSCRCLFFRSMFHVFWSNSENGEVEHETPLSLKSFKELLRFIYSGKLESFQEKSVSEEILIHGGFYCIDNEYIINYCDKVLEHQSKYDQKL